VFFFSARILHVYWKTQHLPLSSLSLSLLAYTHPILDLGARQKIGGRSVPPHHLRRHRSHITPTSFLSSNLTQKEEEANFGGEKKEKRKKKQTKNVYVRNPKKQKG